MIILGNGLLASSLIKVCKEQQVYYRQITRKDFDFISSDVHEVTRFIGNTSTRNGSNEVINCIAYTNVDGCEDNQELALNTNVGIPTKLAVACQTTGIKLIHISSDYVFDGKSRHPYIEYDQTNPLSFYGFTKLQGENVIKNSGCSYVIVRTGGIYNHKKGMVANLFTTMRNNNQVSAFEDRIFTPTNAEDLSKQLLVLRDRKFLGTFHCTNLGSTNPFEVVTFIKNKLGLTCEIEKVSKFMFYSRARRPEMCLLDNFNLKLLGINIMPTWDVSLDNFLKQL